MNSSGSSGKKRKRKHSSEKEPDYGDVALEQLPMNALRFVWWLYWFHCARLSLYYIVSSLLGRIDCCFLSQFHFNDKMPKFLIYLI